MLVNFHSSIQNLEKKEAAIGGFAIFAKNVSRCKKNTAQYQQRLEYIKSLFEVHYNTLSLH